jgi:FkbM family methyltransferase
MARKGILKERALHRVMTRYGDLDILDSSHDLISRFLTMYGEWAQNEIAFVAANTRDHSRVADIGAFLGTFGIGLSQVRQLDKICFVDANPTIIPLLKENVGRCATTQYDIKEAIVGASSGGFFGTMSSGNAGSFSVAQAGKGENEAGVEKITVPAAAKTYLMAELDKESGPFDLVKIDAEGMESDILKSSPEYFHSFQGNLWIECNETSGSLDLVDLLHSSGFDIYYYAFPAIAENNYNGKKDREYPFAYEAGLWATKGPAPIVPPSLSEHGCLLKEITSRESLRQALWFTPRWSPEGWGGRSMSEVVALASREVIGLRYENYLVPAKEGGAIGSVAKSEDAEKSPSGMPDTAMGNMIEVMHNQLQAERARRRQMEIEVEQQSAALVQQLHAKNKEVEQAAATVRSVEILLFEERSRFKTAFESSDSERRGLAERLDIANGNLDSIYRSRSWRAMMPARMMGRILRGQWRDVIRLIRTKF